MHPFPHHYTVTATAGSTGVITHPDDRLPSLLCNAPAEFGGPGDQWSPEDLLAAAVADCFILTFRAVAAASAFAWDSISARAEGQLEELRPGRLEELPVDPLCAVQLESARGDA